MNQKRFARIAGWAFAVVALLHGLRLAYGWEVQVEEWFVPMWVSWAAVLVAVYLGYTAFRLAK